MLAFSIIVPDHRNTIVHEGAATLFIKEFFFEPLLLKELNGYEIVSEYYPVAKLLNRDKYQEESRLVYEFEESIGQNKGLLLDIFNQASNTENSSIFDAILNMYGSVFNNTIEKTRADSADIFFKDRAEKLKEKYHTLFTSKVPIEIKFNTSRMRINFDEIVNSIVSDFDEKDDCIYWSIVSQGDPSDVNIGTKPVLLDYLCGGRVPLMAEFASLVWEQIAQSAILAPAYNPKAYADHDLVYRNMPTITMKDGNLRFTPIKERVTFLTKYTQQVIMPIMEKISYPDWYRDFKNFIAMRIVGVFDINNFSPEHRALALGYLGLFYNVWTPRTPLELIEYIDKQSNGHI